MGEHTPGPWIAGQYTVNAEHRVICRMMPEYGLTTDGEDAANGRLMAAAPDLLAACEAVSERMRARAALYRELGYTGLAAEEAEETAHLLDLVIARAKGG